MTLTAPSLEELDYARARIRNIPDFPTPGIQFKDLSPLLNDPRAFETVVSGLHHALDGREIDHIVAVESRGFFFGAPLALRLGVGLIPVRKPGKLPAETRAVSYSLEYGQATLEIHADALKPGSRVAIIDDVLATGGTARATAELVEAFGARVTAYGFALELGVLGGRALLGDLEIVSLLRF